MNNYEDFTEDPIHFGDLKDFIDELHGQGMRYVPIVDAGVAKRDNEGYNAYEDGVA
jgi:alpha-glucosidase (family GH31 glycosyl hydrolase)